MSRSTPGFPSENQRTPGSKGITATAVKLSTPESDTSYLRAELLYHTMLYTTLHYSTLLYSTLVLYQSVAGHRKPKKSSNCGESTASRRRARQRPPASQAKQKQTSTRLVPSLRVQVPTRRTLGFYIGIYCYGLGQVLLISGHCRVLGP